MLTSFIRDNADVRQRMDLEFKKPHLAASKPPLVPHLSGRSSLIGTAFDYLLRFRVSRINPQTIQGRRWVAEAAVEYLTAFDHWEKDSPFLPAAMKIIADAKLHLAAFLADGIVSRSLIKSSLLLATLDSFVRSFDAKEELIGIIHEEDIDEIQSLSNLVNEKDFKAHNLCLLNPTFGLASELVEGADADLVIDDTIIDIKTTKFLRLDVGAFRQVMGYYVLHHLGNVGELDPKPAITKVAIYFSRYGFLFQIPLADIVNPNTFPDFLRWFEKRAKEDYPKEMRG